MMCNFLTLHQYNSFPGERGGREIERGDKRMFKVFKVANEKSQTSSLEYE